MMGGYNISWENIFIWVGVLKRSKIIEQKIPEYWCLFLSQHFSRFFLCSHAFLDRHQPTAFMVTQLNYYKNLIFKENVEFYNVQDSKKF